MCAAGEWNSAENGFAAAELKSLLQDRSALLEKLWVAYGQYVRELRELRRELGELRNEIERKS